MMPLIQSLRATLTQDSARRLLAPNGIQGQLLRWVRGDIRALADVFIPYRLYKVAIDDRGARTSRYYAIDAASGSLDPYEFSAPPDLDEVSTRNVINSTVNEITTRERAIERMRRKLYASGFFRLRNPLITAELVGQEFYVPYWAGFFGEERHLNVTVADAVRHSVEGAKVRRVIQDWLMGQPGDESLPAI